MTSRTARRVARLASVAVALAWLPALPGAQAQDADPLIADSLAALAALATPELCVVKDAADGDPANGTELPYRFCDDGVVPSGGGSKGIPVPVKYAADETGNDSAGLPAPADQAAVDAADAEFDLKPEVGNRITLDVDVSLPPEGLAPPSTRGYPVIVFMHGCCGGNRSSWEAATIDQAREHWHHSNAWFAARGYVVINYTARGFRDANDAGSTGSTQLDSRRFEVNDYQYLVGLLVDHDAQAREAGQVPLFNVDPKRVAAVGGSYGGGFSWLALTDPTWTSPLFGIKIKLRAVVPKYGWTDLVEALVPSGHYLDRVPGTNKTAIASTDPLEAASRAPIGVEKQSIVAGLYATGNLANGNHTTFPQYMHDTFARLQQGEPYEGDETVESALTTFLADRSAYFQEDFWERVSKGLRVPIFSAATWTDPLFPTMEHVRFYNKLKKVDPDYPITMYLGDYQHFVQNKATEWGDLCGEDHHVCTIDDYRRTDGRLLLGKALTRVRQGINSRINKFLDHYLKGKGKKPKSDVTATTTICAANATDRYPVTEPGIEYGAPTWRALAPTISSFEWEGGGAATTTTSSIAQDAHATDADPVARDRQTDKCHTTDQTAAPAGIAQYVSEEIGEPFTLMGIPTLNVAFDTMATNYWIGARLYDRAPDGTMTMVTRGVCRADTAVAPDLACDVFDLWGNAWTFDAGHSIVVEMTQADTPFLRRNNLPSTLSITSLKLDVPVTDESLRRDFRG